MANVKDCVVCILGEDVCAQVSKMDLLGLTSKEVVDFLGKDGHRVTQRQVVAHRRHSLSPRLDVAVIGTPQNPEVCPDESLSLLSGERGLTDLERESRLILGFLTATDRMLQTLEDTGSVRVSRAAVELGTLAHNMLQTRMKRIDYPDPLIVVNVTVEDIEAKLFPEKPLEDLDG